jgi:hypothetical protein
LQNGTPKDQRAEEQNQIRRKKKRACGQSGRGIPTAERKSGRSVSDESGKRIEVSGAAVGHCFDESGEQSGCVDSIDLPTLAYARPPGDSGGSFGATLRQSEIGFEAFGPTVAGAKTTADLQLDLAGGFPPVPNGINSGLVRLRTATLRMDWTNTSVVVGQDAIFFSPNSPTSFATLAIPALSYAGNLWGWVPQIRVEHRVALGKSRA